MKRLLLVLAMAIATPAVQAITQRDAAFQEGLSMLCTCKAKLVAAVKGKTGLSDRERDQIDTALKLVERSLQYGSGSIVKKIKREIKEIKGLLLRV